MYSNDATAEPKARLNENPNDAEAAATLGNIYYDMKDAPRAILYYLVTLGIDPDQPAVRTDMGAMLWQNGDVALAEQAFRRVIADHPGFGNAYINLGHLLREARKDTDQAREIWRTLVTNYPDDPAVAEAIRLLAKE